MSIVSYLTGFVALAVAIGACSVIGMVGRRWLVPGLTGPVGLVAAVPIAVAGAILPALTLGTFGLMTGWTWLPLTAALAAFAWRFRHRLPRTEPARSGERVVEIPPAPGNSPLLTAVGTAVAAAAFGIFAAATATKLGTGMSVFDTNWYHGPLSVEMARTGDTLALHQVAPAFLSWFYPQNSELLHTLGMLIFGNDLASPFINLAWFAGCLTAAWAVGRPYGAAPISLAAVALILGSGAMADQAGEARNDIVGAFFVLAALAVLLNSACGGRPILPGTAVVIGLSAGLAAGTKLNFIPASVLLTAAAIWLAMPGDRRRSAGWAILAGLVGGGYWYLRNLIHSGNPLPWIKQLGPLTLPGPGQETGGREAGSVFGYVNDLDVVREWFVPGLRDAFGAGWLVLLALALTGIALCLSRRSGPARRIAAAVALALLLAWFLAPTSASGYPGRPSGFLTGLRYLAPALVVAMALLGSGAGTRGAATKWTVTGLLVLLAPFAIRGGDFPSFRYWIIAALAAAGFWMVICGFLLARRLHQGRSPGTRRGPGRGAIATAVVALIAIAVAGQPVQRYYFDHRYTTADYVTPGLAAAFEWARSVSGTRIGTTASRMYPFYGTYLANQVGFVGEHRPRGGFVRPEGCAAFRQAVNRGGYRYLVTAYDRLAAGQDFPREAGWIADDPAARAIVRARGAAVFELSGPLDPAGCP